MASIFEVCRDCFARNLGLIALLGLGAASATTSRAESLPNGGVIHGYISVPGERVSYGFEGTAGHFVALRTGDPNLSDRLSPTMEIYAPDGSRVAYGEGDYWFYPKSTGEHTVVIRAGANAQDAVGPYDLYYVDAPGADEGGTLINGSSVTGRIDTGDIDTYTFYAASNKTVWLRVGDPNTLDAMSPVLTVIGPDGKVVSGVTYRSEVFFQSNQSGVYTVLVWDDNTGYRDIGPYELHYLQAPGANEGGRLINGGERGGQITVGDLDTFTFEALEGDTVKLTAVDQDAADTMFPRIRVVTPDGQPGNFVSNTVTLNQTQAGVYTVVVADGSDSFKRVSGPYSISYLLERESLSYVALGDSYSSGEGVAPYRDLGDRLLSGCHRATRAYSTAVVAPGNSVPVSKRPDAQFDFLACSGAVTDNVRANGEGQNGEPPQLAASNAVDARRDLATISIGGNDVYFARIVAYCLAHSDCDNSKPFFPLSNLTLAQLTDLWIDGAQLKVQAVHSELRAAASNATVMVLGYPLLVSGTECSAASLPPVGKLSAAEQKWMRKANARLNQAIADSAASAGVHFIDVAQRFSGHEVCGKKDPWVNGVVLFNPKASFHPTLRGQQEYAAAINGFLGTALSDPLQGRYASGLPVNPPPKPEQRRQHRVLPLSELPAFGELDVSAPWAPAGCPNAQGLISPGQVVRLKGSGFQASESVTVSLIANEQAFGLGSASADANGLLYADILVPANLPATDAATFEAYGAGLSGHGLMLNATARLVPAASLDTDGDGIPDLCDNCTLVANADQRDTDGDGFGNVCDGDINNDGIVDRADQKLLKAAMGSRGDGQDADLDGNRLVDSADLKLLKRSLGLPPGPSAASR